MEEATTQAIGKKRGNATTYVMVAGYFFGWES
jgi:hypothetical protein